VHGRGRGGARLALRGSWVMGAGSKGARVLTHREKRKMTTIRMAA
jgi:hypothetical protein